MGDIISERWAASNRNGGRDHIGIRTFAATTANVAYTYDLAGRPLTALFATVAGTPGVSWSYDAAGRRIREGTSGRNLTFAYDADGNPAGLTWPGGQLHLRRGGPFRLGGRRRGERHRQL